MEGKLVVGVWLGLLQYETGKKTLGCGRWIKTTKGIRRINQGGKKKDIRLLKT